MDDPICCLVILTRTLIQPTWKLLLKTRRTTFLEHMLFVDRRSMYAKTLMGRDECILV